jgi:hypothetical protein
MADKVILPQVALFITDDPYRKWSKLGKKMA